MLIPKYSCGTDDISFCIDGEKCGDTTCFRHPNNMIYKEIPHSFSKFAGSAVCPKNRRDGELYESCSRSDAG